MNERLHGLDAVSSLDAMPIRGDGIAAVELLELRTSAGSPAHDCTLAAWRPRTEDGLEPEASLVLCAERAPLRPASEPERCSFEYDGDVQRVQVRVPDKSSLYGAGEVPAPLLRTGRRVVLWNTDAFGHGEYTEALYQSHPFVLAVLPDGGALGLVADTTQRGEIAFGTDGVELAFRGRFELVRIEGPSPASVLRALAALIGSLPLPPLWALGYHQCRWSYENEAEVREIAAQLRHRNLPCDAIWLDIDHMDRFRPLTFDPRRFPRPAELVRELHERGLRCVAIVDPGIAIADDHERCTSGLAGEHFVLDRDGRPAVGRVWPGRCHFPDFTRAETRAWWAAGVRSFVEDVPLDGLWCDMNEPALQRTPLRTLPDDARHRGLGGGSHARFHNLYGQLMARATREGLARARPERRPFVLTRADHLGGARHAATWTGDNQSCWEDLRQAVSMVLSLGLSGQPFSGPDVPGFQGDPDPELAVRFFELGALLPLFRGHAEKFSCRKEPWSFGPEAEAHIRHALEQRMRLLPTYYTLFRAAADHGLPVCRPVFFADPADARLRAVDDAFLIGDDLLVAPVLEPGLERRSVVLPRGPVDGWYRYPDGGELLTAETVACDAPLGTTPLFARAGAILAETTSAQHTTDALWNELTLHVFLDARGCAEGRLYEDEGEGHAHRDGAFRDTRFRARLDGERLTVEATRNGDLAAHGRLKLEVHAPARVSPHATRSTHLVARGDPAWKLKLGESI